MPIAAPLLAALIYPSGSLKSPNGPSIALNPKALQVATNFESP